MSLRGNMFKNKEGICFVWKDLSTDSGYARKGTVDTRGKEQWIREERDSG